jgi:hypothetical protein
VTCSRCGAEIDAGSPFCGRCGTPVAAAASPPPAGPAGPAAQPSPSGPPQAASPSGTAPYAPPGGQPYGQAYGQAYGQPYGQQPQSQGQPQQAPYPAAAPGWPPYGPPAPRPAGTGQNLKVVAGILGIVAALLVLAGSALPYARVSEGLPGKYTSLSIFNAGPGASLNNLWFTAEPILVALLGIVGGIVLLASRRDIVLSIVAGMLTALGAQTFFLFVGYALGLDFGTNKLAVGGFVGMLGGVVLGVAGILALIGEAGFFRRVAAGQATTPGQAAPGQAATPGQ